jgi:transposase
MAKPRRPRTGTREARVDAATYRNQSREIATLTARVSELETQLAAYQQLAQNLLVQCEDLKRRLYGPSSEKRPADEASSSTGNPDEGGPGGDGGKEGDENNTADGEMSTALSAKHADTPKKRGGGRRPLPEHLPVICDIIDLPEDQREGMVWIRNEVTRLLERYPAVFYVREIIRRVYASPQRLMPPRVMPLPPQVIPQARVGVSFIAHTVVGKYLDHVPHYRQAQIDKRAGVTINRQARYRYAQAAALLLVTIRDQLKRRVLQSGYVQVDETFTALCDPDRPGATRTAYLWGYLSPHQQAVVLEFATSRRADILEDTFAPNWRGTVQTDGASMYPSVFEHRPYTRHIQCLQHWRRYVFAAFLDQEPLAIPLLDGIGELYAIEREAEERGFNHFQRGQWRHAKAKPILKRLQRQLLQLDADPAVQGKLKEAVTYGLNRWQPLVTYAKVDNGHLLIDNNSIERIFRPTKLGLKNYLFIGHPAAGWVSAVLYTVMGTCRLVGVDPYNYLVWVLPTLAAAKSSQVEGLLPHDFAKLSLEQQQPVVPLVNLLGAAPLQRPAAETAEGLLKTG